MSKFHLQMISDFVFDRSTILKYQNVFQLILTLYYTPYIQINLDKFRQIQINMQQLKNTLSLSQYHQILPNFLLQYIPIQNSIILQTHSFYRFILTINYTKLHSTQIKTLYLQTLFKSSQIYTQHPNNYLALSITNNQTLQPSLIQSKSLQIYTQYHLNPSLSIPHLKLTKQTPTILFIYQKYTTTLSIIFNIMLSPLKQEEKQINRRNYLTSRESIIMMKSKENLIGSLSIFQNNIETTIKREQMKKTLAIEDAKSNFYSLKKVKSDLMNKLKREKEQRDLPIKRMKEKFKDITSFREQLEGRFKSLSEKYKKQRNRRQELRQVYDQLRQRVQQKLKSSSQLQNSKVVSYIRQHENKTKQTVKLQNLLLQQFRKQKHFYKQYLQKKKQVQKTKQILQSVDYRISQTTLHKKRQEALREVSQYQKVLQNIQKLLNCGQKVDESFLDD